VLADYPVAVSFVVNGCEIAVILRDIVTTTDVLTFMPDP
jgi:hypothetical protein